MAGSKKKKRDTAERSPASDLSDDLLVEIISRVPYKSTRRCKCVCRRWRDLVSDPDHRKKLPRSTLAGFFYQSYNGNYSSRYVSRRYRSVSGNWCPQINGTLSFLPDCERLDGCLLDSCNGLLLLRRQERKEIDSKILDYVVCNPATETWVAVPATEWTGKVPEARLGFDPAVSSHFHVFEFVHAGMWEVDNGRHSTHTKSVGIYSSGAGIWTHPRVWNQPMAFTASSRSAFLDGVLYLPSFADNVIAVVDVEGNRRAICFPMPYVYGVSSDLYLSRRQLYLAHYGSTELSIWALEDSSSGNWTLKHNVSCLQLFGQGYSSYVLKYNVIIHPEDDVIYVLCTTSFTGPRRAVTKLLSYKMDFRKLHFIYDLGKGCTTPYLSFLRRVIARCPLEDLIAQYNALHKCESFFVVEKEQLYILDCRIGITTRTCLGLHIIKKTFIGVSYYISLNSNYCCN